MYSTRIFELAMSICSYKLDQVFYGEGATVRQVYGQVPVVQKVTISGKRKTVTKWKSLRWNDARAMLLPIFHPTSAELRSSPPERRRTTENE